MHGSAARHRRCNRDGGFTVLELTIAMGIAAFAFSALAALLMGSLKTLAVQKARTQGNEIATQGIEDLQRLSYNNLGLCEDPDVPPAVAPSGLGDTVLLANCGGPPATFEPCSGANPAVGAVPAPRYTCTRRNITYNVKRYVSYGDVAHTKKRLAVFVNWRDSVGVHEVSQQSSLRIPSRNALVGLAPPTVTSAGTSFPASVALDAAGANVSAIPIAARTTGLQSGVGDAVLASFSTLEGGQPTQSTVVLTTTNGTDWSGSIPAFSTVFGNGTQFITFTAIRKSDGKVNSLVYSPNAAGTPPPPVAFGSGGSASIDSAALTSPGTPNISIDGSGDLKSPTTSFTVSVTTTNVSPDDSMVMVFPTQTGAVAFALSPVSFSGPSNTCVVGNCAGVWTGTIDQGGGYHFNAGAQRLYFQAIQDNGPNPVSVGSTTAATSALITFAT